jgi:hypothetical protein
MAATADPAYHTSGFIRLTRPQLVGTLGGLLLALLVAALHQTVVGTSVISPMRQLGVSAGTEVAPS